jgi:GntR family transcriptional regulator, transcriptional repressor for pyruvate dehydrogenase complex
MRDSKAGKTQEKGLFTPLPGKRVFEEIADQIRNLIYAKTLKPGDKLPSERELAVQFKTGRISVREALRILEQAGLVSVRQGSDGGAFVREVDLSHASESIFDLIRRADMSLKDLTEVRIWVEELVMELALQRMSRDDLSLLERNMQEAEAILKGIKASNGAAIDLGSALIVNFDFHLIIARSTKNPLLELIIESLIKGTQHFFGRKHFLLDSLEQHIDHHKAILEAIKAKRLAKAKEVLKCHSLRIQQDFFKAFSGPRGRNATKRRH